MARPLTGAARRIATAFAVVAALVVAGAIVLVVLVVIATQDRDGDDLAEDRVEQVAQSLADDLSRIREPIDAETVAAERFRSVEATVEPLSWSGDGDGGQAMIIDARISAAVAANSIGGYFGPFNSEGSAVMCYRFSVVALQASEYEEISCEGFAEPAAPPTSSRPSVPADAAQRVERILSTTPGTELADALRTEFPGADFTVDAVETPAQELVAAVGVSPGSDCVLRVLLPSGEIIAPSCDRIWLEPGGARLLHRAVHITSALSV
ncbi:hypothetical protein [Microbacterium sp. SD291]|uniref:hypothetical protein n=1 Tax=Microbacterium sp. SD291 TaxID=2782007 RepID=UPI001A97C46C|nr:hypothetical protein [Microbacterium sp. SD291]MBO0979852.1 hypothetical protein [Microbacterium sp. SD291]